MDRLDQLFQQFLRERTYITNVTPKTLAWYEAAWKSFKRSRPAASPQPASESLISRTDLQSFVVHLRERGVRPVTCNTWLRALNAFCRWLHEQGEIPSLVKLAPQRLEKRIIRTHDEPALRMLLTYRPKTTDDFVFFPSLL
jgi:site-specific recombinase XerD